MRRDPSKPIRLHLARLSRKIVAWIFFSVIVIEAIILIPSARNRRIELLDQRYQLSDTRVQIIAEMMDRYALHNASSVFDWQTCLNQTMIIGGTLYGSGDQPPNTFGSPPALSIADVRNKKIRSQWYAKGPYYDTVHALKSNDQSWTLILRHDATDVNQAIRSFILRIAGLVIIISLFVTVGAWFALGPIVVRPIVRLRNDLVAAGEAVINDVQAPRFYSNAKNRKDELGEVINAFHGMYGQISTAIAERKQAQWALQQSLEQVNAYSAMLNGELEKGRQIQTNFLPQTLPQAAGWQIEAFFRPARQVAGDFYDIFELSPSRIGIVIADVCDKGVGAALFMALIRSLIRIFSGQTALEGIECRLPQTGADDVISQDADYLRAVALTNHYIAHNHDELAMFATLFFGVLDTRSGTLSYISGGHEPLFVLSADGQIRHRLTHSGPAVGLMPDAEFKTRTIRLEAGETLFGYTDGVTEATNDRDDFFGMARLLELLSEDPGDAHRLLDRIKSAVLAHMGENNQFDDITMVAVSRTDPPL